MNICEWNASPEPIDHDPEVESDDDGWALFHAGELEVARLTNEMFDSETRIK